jgi:hypothetical protein
LNWSSSAWAPERADGGAGLALLVGAGDLPEREQRAEDGQQADQEGQAGGAGGQYRTACWAVGGAAFDAGHASDLGRLASVLCTGLPSSSLGGSAVSDGGCVGRS